MSAPILFLAALLVLQQPPAPAELKLDRIDVVGTKRYPAAEVIRLSGLAQGQAITDTGVQKAGQQIVATGLFKSLRYRYETADGKGHVTFEIVEEDWTRPVVFDNFVWFTDEELTTAVRAEVPSFDGKAPGTEAASAFIGRALQRIIDARRIGGEVQVRDRVNIRTGSHQWIYKVNGAGLQLCALRTPGATAALASLLQQAAKDDVIGKDYSRSFLVDFAEGTLRQIYAKRGYLKAVFGAPAAAATGACPGVMVTLPVDEGLAYVWGAAEWVGNTAVTAKDLDGLIGIKRGDVADLVRFEEGLRAVETAYEKMGRLERRLAPVPRLDDAARTAAFVITIAEGPEYRMGALEFGGFTPGQAAELTKKWTLKSGVPFDASYQNQFELKELRGFRFGGERRINSTTHVVDVRFTLK